MALLTENKRGVALAVTRYRTIRKQRRLYERWRSGRAESVASQAEPVVLGVQLDLFAEWAS